MDMDEQDTFCAPAKALLKDGAWVVPVEDRPLNWRQITERECLPDIPNTDPPLTMSRPLLSETIAPTDATPFEYPLPPEKYKNVFLPIFEGLHSGLIARKELLDLTHYCMQLEVTLLEQDVKRAAIAQGREE